MSYTPALPTISDTIWTDNFNFFYIRQDQISSSGALVTTWYDAATGQVTYPNPTIYPIGNNTNTTVFRDYYDVVVMGPYGVYNIGDTLLRISIFDPAKNTVVLTTWVNLTSMSLLIAQYWPSTPYTTIVSRDLVSARGRITLPNASIISTTTETAILAANSVLYTDLRSLVVSNTSASPVSISIRDAGSLTLTGGTGGVSSSTLTVTALASIVSNTLSTSPMAAGTFVAGQAYQIVFAGSTAFTSIGSSDNNVSTVFTATGVGSGTGTAIPVNIVPGMVLSGTGITAGTTILAYGKSSTTGTGGAGTYALSTACTVTAGTSISAIKPPSAFIQVPATDMKQLSFPIDAKLLQSALSATWTATLSSAVTDVRITAVGNPIHY